MYDVIAIGEMLIDFTVERVQEDGYPVMAAHPGGAPANFLAALARRGRRTAMLAKVGRDAFGRQLLDTVAQVGIDGRGIVVADDAFTTLAFVTRDANGEREFSFARKPGADMLLRTEEIDFSMVDETQVVHFGTVCMTDEPARATHKAVVAYARKAGKLVTFDPNLREPLWASLDDAREQMLWGCANADVVKISDNEVEFLFGCTPEEGARRLLETYGAKLVFVTLGKDGCCYANGRAMGRVPGLSGVSVVDRLAVAQARPAMRRSSSAVSSSGAFPLSSTPQTAVPPKMSPAPVVSTTLTPDRPGTRPMARPLA